MTRQTALLSPALLTRKPAAPMCWRKHCSTDDRVSLQAPGPPQGVARAQTKYFKPRIWTHFMLQHGNKIDLTVCPLSMTHTIHYQSGRKIHTFMKNKIY